MAYIYRIWNDVNNKDYIGKTMYSISKRWKEHCQDYLKPNVQNRPLYKAMQKYGLEHFHIELVEECLGSLASERERYWIEQYGSFKYGYNATKGGDGKPYADYELIYSLWKDGKTAREIHQLTGYDTKTIKVALEENNVLAEERKNRQKELISRPVAMLDKNTKEIIKVFTSRREAYAYLGKQHSGHIAEVCKGKRKTAYGYAWKEL